MVVQSVPHMPQFMGSEVVSVHPAEHMVCPLGQLDPAWQTLPTQV